MAKKSVFISYDHSEDLHYKRLLAAWDANENFDFEFDDRSPSVRIDSDEASRVKAALTAKMKSAEYLLVLVGEKTNGSKWVNWEIERAKQDDIKLKLVAVKLKSTNTPPSGLLNSGTSWAYSFNREDIVEALKKAKVGY